ncbi:DNA-binding transcriptional regulator, FadR family [Halobacillus karajensis]|uniref:FadR/GntR family transcriptional regulator n=1 Tax=Halobacillus karajensis TaxID=195088 RepID=UPI0008A7BFF6|nr:FadR/GntR family transcriptional regulator [Halobacillus karajensis]SEI01252.1 DNA-binding transcriptional regulator, FadR family [Halobacillus karajensis]
MNELQKDLNMKTVKRKTLSNQVIEQIIDLLMSGQLKAGDKLPSEMKLMDMLNVSRPVLREALISLETLGVVHRKTREGTFFTDRVGSEPYRIMLAISMGDMESIIETRLSQELGLVTLAAEKITELDLKRLEENIRAMEEAEGDYSEIDREFHRIIAFSGSNPITEGIIDPLLNMYDKTLENIPLKNRDKEKTVQQHREIYEALENRDPLAAHASMHRHLVYVRERLSY